ncbi:MAG: winged helix-turn-helix domain-containing protein [Candidatus Thorarchaeota archaeon]
MNSSSNLLTQGKNEVLEDETRISIYIYLMVHSELTLKQLGEYLHKGKTTIHHHIKKLEESGIVKYREDKKDARRQLKTRYYSISTNELLRGDKNRTLNLIKINKMILSILTDWWIEYLENESDADYNRMLSLFDIDLDHPAKPRNEKTSFSHLSATIKMPILDILRWREKSLKK